MPRKQDGSPDWVTIGLIAIVLLFIIAASVGIAMAPGSVGV